MKELTIQKALTGMLEIGAVAMVATSGCASEPAYVPPPAPNVVVETPPPVAVEPPPAPVPPPPPVQADVVVAAPGPGFVWVGGYWNWSGARWIWAPGHWGRPPYRGAVWVRGHWGPRGHWEGGRWR